VSEHGLPQVMTTGEGGIVVTNNPDLAKKMVCFNASVFLSLAWRNQQDTKHLCRDWWDWQVFLRGHAMSPQKRFWHTEVGFNYRQAAPHAEARRGRAGGG